MRNRKLVWSLLIAGLAAAGCSEEFTGPSPKLNDPAAGGSIPVEPGIVCNEQHPDGGTALRLSGQSMGAATYDVPNDPSVELPSITLTRTAGVDGGMAASATVNYSGLSDGENAGLVTWSSQREMSFAITNELAVEPGLYDVTVTNPDKSSDTAASALAVVPRPVLASISSGLVCLMPTGRQLTLGGTGFLNVGDGGPTVTIGDLTQMPSLTGCVDIPHPSIDAETCTEGGINLPFESLEPGVYDVVIQNPPSADCSSLPAEDNITLRVLGPPTIETSAPATFCSTSVGTETITFTGSNFVNADGQSFMVTVNGVDVVPDSVDGCETVDNAGFDAEICNSFTVTVDLTGLPLGGVDVSVTNPEIVGCGVSTSTVLNIVGPPTVTGVEPGEICSDQAQTFTLRGTNFGPNPTVMVGNVAAEMVTVVSPEEMTVTFTEGVPAGTYDITVDNGDGCSAVSQGVLLVNPTPITFFVDPRVVYNDITVEVTIFTSGLTEDAASVELIDANGNVTNVTGFISPVRPNRILATLPAGIPAGDYDVRVTSQDGCGSVINGRLTITDNLTLTLDSIDPSYVSPTVDTAVRIEAGMPASFVSTPRAYLTPNPANANVRATALRAVVQVDGDTLTGIVPGGMSPGAYDLIVVNPTGEVGVLDTAVTVTPNEPPVINTVTPASLASNANYPVTIAGSDFDPAGVTVSLTCQDPTGTVADYPATVSANSATSITAVVPSGSLAAGTICVVTVTNTAEGSSFTYSAISITNSSFNLSPWEATTPMNTARRGLALVAGRPTNTSRYLYAVGGDSGNAGTTFTSTELTPVGQFGELSGWFDQKNQLPSPRAFAGRERIGRFIYLLGGTDGTVAQDTAWRAQVLAPLDTPEIVDVDAALTDGTTGLGEGVWIYRVSAIYPASDASNPNGESLPGDPQVVELPAVNGKIEISLSWDVDPRASGYRIYRTPAAGDSLDQLQLLAEVDSTNTTYTDLGADTDPMVTPYREGETGMWHPVGTLNTARTRLTAISAPIPGSPNTHVLYAIGGRGTGGNYLNTIEYAIVTVAADGTQTVGAWQTATATLGAAKAEHGAFRVGSTDTVAVPVGETWIYIGPGMNAGGAVNGLEAFEVAADGNIASFMTVNRTVSSDPQGYACGASNGRLYIFGGQNGTASSGGISAEMCAAPGGQCANIPPDLKSGAWNSLGISMSVGRVYGQAAQESAFYFVGGGVTDTGMATTSVDQTVQ